MGRIGQLISFVRALVGETKVSDVKVDRGGGDNRTPQHFSAPGDDAFPLPGDFVAIIDQAGTGRDSAVGYVDPKNLQKATAGDKRIYARDANGDQIVELWLKSDGTATLSNANGSVTLRPDGGTVTTTPLSTFDADADGSIAGTNGNGNFELQAGGTFEVNGVTIDPAGNIITPTTLSAATVAASTSMTAVGKELVGHDHPITGGSSAPGPTGPNN
jgi:hypothetical protein